MEVLGKPRTAVVLVWGVPAGTGEHPLSNGDPDATLVCFLDPEGSGKRMRAISTEGRSIQDRTPRGMISSGLVFREGLCPYSKPFRGKGNEGRSIDLGTLLWFPSEDGRSLTGWIPGPIRSPFEILRGGFLAVPGWSLGVFTYSDDIIRG
jgi:hypothetical protein